eukprot:9393388-Pyramimonas_sp.AAC.1
MDARAMCCSVFLRACAPCKCIMRLSVAFATGMRAARAAPRRSQELKNTPGGCAPNVPQEP